MTTRTTFHLNISRPALALARIRAWLAQRDPILLVAPIIVSTLLGLILGVQLWRIVRPVQTTAAQPTALAPIMIIATARAEQLPTAAPTAPPRLITAYDQPNGVAFPDPIPEPAPSTWLARWGDGWIEVQWSPNPVWIKVEDLGAKLADLRPVPAVQIAPVAAPAEQQYHTASEPPADELGSPPTPLIQISAEQQAAIQREFGLTDADRQQALRDHQAQQLASCDAGRIANAAYCAAVHEWMEEHR
jgi:hypothetical protein